MSPAATALTGRDQPCPEPHRPAPDRPRCTRFLDLSAMLTAPMCARAWTREILREWQLADLADSAESIVSEVAANAVVHAPAGPGQSVIRLALAFDNGGLVILAGDGNPDLPVVTHPDADAERGPACRWWKSSAACGASTRSTTGLPRWCGRGGGA